MKPMRFCAHASEKRKESAQDLGSKEWGADLWGIAQTRAQHLRHEYIEQAKMRQASTWTNFWVPLCHFPSSEITSTGCSGKNNTPVIKAGLHSGKANLIVAQFILIASLTKVIWSAVCGDYHQNWQHVHYHFHMISFSVHLCAQEMTTFLLAHVRTCKRK